MGRKQSKYMAQSVNTSDGWMSGGCSPDGSSPGPQQLPVLLLDAAVDGVVEAAVGHHEVGDDLGVVDAGEQVERHLHGQRGEEVAELCGGIEGDDDVVGPVEQSKRRDSGRGEKQRGLWVFKIKKRISRFNRCFLCEVVILVPPVQLVPAQPLQ